MMSMDGLLKVVFLLYHSKRPRILFLQPDAAEGFSAKPLLSFCAQRSEVAESRRCVDPAVSSRMTGGG
jgi:hypothetical protein